LAKAQLNSITAVTGWIGARALEPALLGGIHRKPDTGSQHSRLSAEQIDNYSPDHSFSRYYIADYTITIIIFRQGVIISCLS